MKFDFNRRYTTIALYAFLVLAGMVLFSSVLGNLKLLSSMFSRILQLLLPFIYAFGIAYILNPVLKFVEKGCLDKLFGDNLKGKTKRAISILISYLFAAGVIVVFVMLVVPQIASSLRSLGDKVMVYINSSDTWMPQLLAYLPDIDFNATLLSYFQQYAESISKAAYAMAAQLGSWTFNFATRFAAGLLNVVVGIIVSIYMLADKERFCASAKRIVYAFFPQKNADWLLQLTSDVNNVFGGFISGKILDSFIIGLICFCGMNCLRLPNAVLISVIVGVTNVIPYFGPFIGAIPSFFIILFDSPIKSLWFLIFIFILQQFDGNILGPKILGDSTGLSAFWVVFAIMLFGGLYGFIGMFLGVPVFSVIYMLIGRLVSAWLGKRGMPAEMDAYCAPDAPLLHSSEGEKAGKEKRFLKKRGAAHMVKPLGLKKNAKDTDKHDEK